MTSGVQPSNSLSCEFQAFVGMRAAPAATAGYRDFTMTVPFDTPLKLWLFSRTLRFTDEFGATVDNQGANLPFVIRTGETRTFTFSAARLVP